MKWFKAVFTFVLLVVLVYALNNKFGDIPPIGKFLNPFSGFWVNAESREVPEERKLNLPGLHTSVGVIFDDQLVPHIFAQNNHDLYFTQGYITAMHRLWQMEFQTHAAAGRISEIVGERALELDRYQRRIGMVYGAKNSLERMMADTTTRQVIEAYTAGINAYIATLSPENYPIEYKLLDYAPEPWTPLKVSLLLKQMANTLSGGSDDLRMTNILNKYGKEIVNNLFPDYPFREDPIVPPGTTWDFTPVTPPKPPDGFLANWVDTVLHKSADAGIGSNNWAVGGEKSATGYPILANDPHLTLSLPSIWYQIQLVSPDVNVYGASLPGAPSVIIGFNEQVAWGVTNVGSDVLDWYQIKFKDGSKTHYWHDNQWKPVKKVVEEIKIRGKESIVDTVYYTHHGPVVYDKEEIPFNKQTPVAHAMRWVAHESDNELMTFYKLNRAKNYTQYTQALTHYASPAQNFIYADVHNDIAIWPNGKFPLKWKEQGKFIMDGTDPAYDWQGWIPQAHNPHVKNPPRGFVSSANQFSADTTYPYYLSWEFESYERGARINQRLEAMQKATPDSLRMLQNDNYNLHAYNVLPALLSLINQSQLTGKQKSAYQQIAGWKYMNDATEVAPTIFNNWWQNINAGIWADDFEAQNGMQMRFPNRDRTVQLLHEPQSGWIDNTKTPVKETLADVVNLSFQAAVDTLYANYGEIGEQWQWAQFKSTDIMHLARIPALSRQDVLTGGGRGIVNATSERNGPSWRMVVALGSELKAFGVYPGGQSGNPGSYYYDNLIETWRNGDLHPLVYLKKADDQNVRIISKWELKK